MSYTKRAYMLMQEEGLTAEEAYARVAAEAQSAGEAPQHSEIEQEYAGQLTLAPDVSVEDAA